MTVLLIRNEIRIINRLTASRYYTMSVKSRKGSKQRAAANTAETISMTTNEKILKECHDLYAAEENGLLS